MLPYRKYVYLVGALGTGLLLLAIDKLELSQISPTKYTIFLLLMIFSELQTIRIKNIHFSMEFCFVYTSIFIFGPMPAALMKALSTLISQVYVVLKNAYDNWDERIIFHVGQHLISFFAAVSLYHHIKNIYLLEHPLYETIVQSLAVGIYFIIKDLSFQYYLSLKHNRPIFESIADILTLDFPAFLMSAIFGVIAVNIYNDSGFPLALLVLAVYLAVVYIFILYITVKNMNRELAAIYDMSANITSTLDLEMVMDIVLNSVQRIVPWDTACLYVFQKGCFVPAIFEGYPDDAVCKLELQLCQKVCGVDFIKEGIILNNCHKDPSLANMSICPPDAKSLIAAPLIANKELIGQLVLTSKKNYIYTKKHLKLLNILASQGAIAMKNAQLFDETAQMAICDGLTGLYNYMYLYSELERQMKNVNARGGCFSFIIIDVDHFKTYNDMYGHVVGDTILKNLADLLRRNVREKDVICRYGGEEFAIVLPGTTSIDALRIAERIRTVIENTPLARVKNNDIHITISAGIASYPTDAASAQDLVNKADKAMIFGAKQKGRNKVVLFRPNMTAEN